MNAKLLLLILLVSSSACSGSTCPALDPLPPRPPATITVAPTPTPCLLPDLPAPLHLGSSMEGDRVVITRQAAAELGVYLVQLHGWVAAAQRCLEARS